MVYTTCACSLGVPYSHPYWVNVKPNGLALALEGIALRLYLLAWQGLLVRQPKGSFGAQP